MTLRLRQVVRDYGTVRALDGVSADFVAGTFTAVMGPSGSGKSTLLHCAAGLDRPTSGDVELDGHRLNDMDETSLTKLRRAKVGFVFQAFNLVPSLTAAHNVSLPLRLAKKRPQGELEALSRVGLADRAGHYPSELSGGEQQRVAIARALITRPSVLFADEPTGALDTRTSREVLKLLTELDMTIVMVTHDPVAASHADRILLLADGRIVDDLPGSAADEVAARMARLEAGSTADEAARVARLKAGSTADEASRVARLKAGSTADEAARMARLKAASAAVEAGSTAAETAAGVAQREAGSTAGGVARREAGSTAAETNSAPAETAAGVARREESC